MYEQSPKLRILSYKFDYPRLQDAVKGWSNNRSATEAKYGHISFWDTSEVTDMDGLFSGYVEKVRVEVEVGVGVGAASNCSKCLDCLKVGMFLCEKGGDDDDGDDVYVEKDKECGNLSEEAAK